MALKDERARLRCYDDLAAKAAPPGPAASAPAAAPGASPAPAASAPVAPPPTPSALAAGGSIHPPGRYLADTWRLDTVRAEIPITDVQPYRPIYFLFARWTGGANQQPSSPAPGHGVLSPQGWDSVEAKFQLSFKSELYGTSWREAPLGFDGFRLWVAYTQQSNWQVYNSLQSRPFRETDYEPELIVTLPRADPSATWKLLNLGLVHQSNGRDNPESRSWNRFYVQGGWERGEFAALGRLWWRFPEGAANDDNPNITSYVGRGDLVLRWSRDDWTVSTLLRHTLKLNPSRGYAQLDLFSPRLAFLGKTRAYLQLTSGYGDSLIDYNFKQNTVGIGLSFGDRW